MSQTGSATDAKEKGPQIDVKDHDSIISSTDGKTDELLGQDKIHVPTFQNESSAMLQPAATNIRDRIVAVEPQTPVKRLREDEPNGASKRRKSNLRSPLDTSEEA